MVIRLIWFCDDGDEVDRLHRDAAACAAKARRGRVSRGRRAGRARGEGAPSACHGGGGGGGDLDGWPVEG